MAGSRASVWLGQRKLSETAVWLLPGCVTFKNRGASWADTELGRSDVPAGISEKAAASSRATLSGSTGPATDTMVSLAMYVRA